MQRRPIKTAIVGLGRIAWSFHLRQIMQHPGFELLAVVDPLAERLREAEVEFNAPAGYLSCEEMYSNEKPDLVVITSPSHLHREQVLQAFKHDCDVFCEKPLALTLGEADEIIAAMQRNGRKLMVYQPHRGSQEIAAIKSILESGWLGKIYLIKRTMTRFSRRNDWQAFLKNGGGMLNNYGSHFIDQFLFLNPVKVEKVRCELRTLVTCGDAEDFVKAVITAENGVLFDLEINMAAAQSLPPWYIAGDCGAAVRDPEQRIWSIKYFDPEELPAIAPQTSLAANNRSYRNGDAIPWKTAVVREEDFAAIDFYQKCWDFFAGGQPPFVPVSETREVVRVLSECRLDAQGKAV